MSQSTFLIAMALLLLAAGGAVYVLARIEVWLDKRDDRGGPR